MGFRVETVPCPLDAAIALFGIWRVGSSERQRTAADAIAAAWDARPWPDARLHEYAVLAGDDGTTLLHFSQMDGETTGAGSDSEWKRDVDAAVPGIERHGVVACRLHRSTPAYGPAREAGCVVLVTREFDGPDVGRAERLVNTIFDGRAQTPPAAGLLAAHFYVSLDGARVFNYALWASADAHRSAIENIPASLASNAEWQQAHSWPGLVNTSFQRFRPDLLLARSAG